MLDSFLGGAAVGFGYFVTIYYMVEPNILQRSSPQWPIVLFGGVAGLFGSIVDSLIGATLQYSGIDSHGKIVERPAAGVKHISGYCLLDNHSVNLISSILTGLVIPWVAFKCWV